MQGLCSSPLVRALPVTVPPPAPLERGDPRIKESESVQVALCPSPVSERLTTGDNRSDWKPRKRLSSATLSSLVVMLSYSWRFGWAILPEHERAVPPQRIGPVHTAFMFWKEVARPSIYVPSSSYHPSTKGPFISLPQNSVHEGKSGINPLHAKVLEKLRSVTWTWICRNLTPVSG